MTRETKIGLLVGLAFIIVIGILLSDYNRVETQAATLNVVATNVRGSTDTPHNGSTTDTVIPPPAPMPRNPVLTPADLRGGSARVEVGGPAPRSRQPVIVTGPRIEENNAVRGDGVTPDTNAAPGRGGSSELERYAQQNGVPIESIDPGARRGNANTNPVPPAAPNNSAPTARRAYVAKEGDTLSKMAGRFMGANTKTNREAIIAANPTLKQNPNNVVVGRTYMIPASSGAPPVAAVPSRPAPAAAAPVASQPQYWYTVKENDSLWKIAASQLGDGNAWTVIKELNKDVLKSSESLKPNMRLRLPAKPVASAQ